jgi:hypothetical protein
MGENWDWRQKYAQYAETPEPQSSQYSPPQGPEAPAPGQGPYAAPYGPPQQHVQPHGYGQPYAGPYPQFAAYPPPVVSRQGGRWFSIAAFICGGIALLFLPILLGPLGIIFGFVAESKGDRIGRVAGIMSIATTAIGMGFSVWVAHKVGVRFGG